MQNIEIYEGALRLIAESVDPEENEDYRDRASFLIAAFASEAEPLDNALRRLAGDTSRQAFNPVCVSLEDTFPCLDRLAPAACSYVAAMLILDYDPQRADFLYNVYRESIAAIHQSFPMITESIVDKYI